MVATTLPAVVRVVDLPIGTTVTGAELYEAVQTSGGVGQSVQLSLSQMMNNTVGALPAGGGTGQILNKLSGANYTSQWSSITQFVAVGTSLATTGSATSIVAFVANQGITSTQILNNAVGTNQVASSLGIASSLSVGGLLTVGGTATVTGTTILSGGLQVTGTTLLTGITGVVGTSQFTGAFNVLGTSLFTGLFGVVGTSQFTGSFNVLGTTLITGVLGQVGTSLMTGQFGVSGTSLHTGLFTVVGTALFTSGAFGIVGTTLVTGIFSVVGTSAFTGGLFSVNGNSFNVLGTSVGINIAANGSRVLTIKTQVTSSSFNSLQMNGYQAAFEVINNANTQNWYFGIDDSDGSKLKIGPGYSPGQGLAATQTMNSTQVAIATTTFAGTAALTVAGIASASTFQGGTLNISGTAVMSTVVIMPGIGTGFLQASSTGVISAAAAGAQNFVLLNTLSPNIVASTNDTSSFTNTYRNYMITFENVVPATSVGTTVLQITVATSASNFVSGSYISQILIANGGTTIVTSGTTAISLTSGGMATATSYGVSGFVKLFNPASSVSRKVMLGEMSYFTGAASTSTLVLIDFNGIYDGTTSPVTGLNFLFNNTNIQTGTIKIYGMT